MYKRQVTGLLKDHDPEVVKIYLHIFQLQRSDGWPEITSLIEATPALQFGEVAEPVAEKPAKPAKKAAKAEKAAAETEEAPAEAAPETEEA